jgi:hypothetical protein
MRERPTLWEDGAHWWPMVTRVLLHPRATFRALPQGEVGRAWTFTALCCLLPRLLYGVVDPRGGPFVTLIRAFLSALAQAASATFFLGTIHFLAVLALARTQASWSMSVRASAYAQPVMMIVGSATSLLMLHPALRHAAGLRDGALLCSAIWLSVPFYFVGERLGLARTKAALASLFTTVGVALVLHAVR